jgi:peptidylprolyl isomerase/peptidyl-prolyl cis-trans isomerase D
MAVLSKIRERSLFLIIIIALALFSFVLSGLFKGNLFDKNKTNIGEVNGEPINREEFAQQVESFRTRSNGRSTNMQNVKNAWDNLVSEKLYKSQLEKSGIVVGEKDVWDAIVQQVSQYNNPQFLNEIGTFDQEKLKEYIATLKDNAEESEQAKAEWLNWLNFEKNIKTNLERTNYNSLINAGLGSTLNEGKSKYYFQNTSVDLDYVYVPFKSISDSLITISKDEIKAYVKAHAKDFKVDESRDIEFVKFDIKATAEDEKEIKNEIAKLINDREEYSNAAKSKVNLVGFKNVKNIKEFFSDYGSDTPFDKNYNIKNKLSKILADNLFDKEVGEVYGPYKENGFYKLSKIIDVKQMPDSVKASHILIPFVGTSTADATVTRTEADAKIYADSILSVVKSNKSKFESLAKEISVDKVSGAKGGDLGWFTYTRMIPEFRDYVFENKTGDIGIVKSQFGFHIIKIDGQKNIQKNIQIATFTHKILPSEKTENEIFEQAETFASDVSSGKSFAEIAKEKKYVVRPVQYIEAIDDNIAQLGSQRSIVRWAFEDGTNENDIKRFDIDNGYAVVKLSKKNKAGLAIRGKNVRQIILTEKKAALIKERSKGESLDEIAKQNNTTVRKTMAVSSSSPVFAGQGRFPKIAGIVTALDENILTKNIVGNSGVVFAKVTKKNLPTDLKNYNSNKKNIERTLKNRSIQIYNAIKDNAEIEDNRAYFY